MLRFEFDTADIPEGEKEFYHNISLEFGQGQDFNIEEITERFKSFLLAMTYPKQVVDKIQIQGNYKTINDNKIGVNELKSFMEGNIHANEQKRD